MTDALIVAVRDGWGWTGVEAESVSAVSPFGHVIVRDSRGAYWYLDPELRTLKKVADDERELAAHMAEPEVREVWEAEALVKAAHHRLGDPEPDRCYSLTPLALLRGDYAHENLCTLPIAEVISFSGVVAEQTKDSPDGATLQIKITD